MSKAKEKNIENRLERIRQYNLNPKLCKTCQTPLSYEQLLQGNEFCKHSCSAMYNNKHRVIINRSNRREPQLCIVCKKETKPKRMFCEPNGKCDLIYHMNRSRDNGIPIAKDTIRRYLLLTRDRVCARCGLSEWLGNTIPLESHHIDGNSNNNEDQNLELVCPNCHVFTDTYKGKNRGNGRDKLKMRGRIAKTVTASCL